MPASDQAAFCEQCGNPIQPEDQFCGSCGAVVLPPAPQAQQVIPRQEAVTQAPTTRNTRTLLLAGVVGVLLLLVGGTVAYATMGSGIGLLGGSEPSSPESPTTQESALSEESTQAPDPAMTLPLQALEPRTEIPIMLPAELPNELKNVGVDENLEGDRYGIVFLSTPPEDLVGGWSNAETRGTFQAVPQSEFEPDQRFEAASTEDVQLSDGTEAKLRYMQPVLRTAMYGSRWEGTFDKEGYTYTLSILLGQKGYVNTKQALSTMVLVRGSEDKPTTPSSTQSPKEKNVPKKSKDQPSGTNASEAKAEEAAGDYYRAAGRQDWDYTYDNLDSQTKRGFTREEWSQKNQWFADNNAATYNIESVNLDDSSQKPLAEVTVRLTGEDGSTSIRNTYFVFEDGSWKHRFGQEEKDLFKPDLSYEEFLEANQ